METALVVLRSAAGRDPDVDDLTARRLAGAAPDPNAVGALREYLRAEGVDVGSLVGISFSVTAPADRLADVFGAPRDDGWGTERLSPRFADLVAAITTGPEMDFGPVDGQR